MATDYREVSQTVLEQCAAYCGRRIYDAKLRKLTQQIHIVRAAIRRQEMQGQDARTILSKRGYLAYLEREHKRTRKEVHKYHVLHTQLLQGTPIKEAILIAKRV